MPLHFEANGTLDAFDSEQVVAEQDEYEDFVDSEHGPFHPEEFIALGIDPTAPTPAKPGSKDKVTMLAARYAAGLPLWHNSDCYDHGPGDRAFADVGDEEIE